MGFLREFKEFAVKGNAVDMAVGEGEAIPVIPNAPECCPGLELIPPISPVPGVLGYCTEFCGDGVCDTTIDSHYNCPEDCGE